MYKVSAAAPAPVRQQASRQSLPDPASAGDLTATGQWGLPSRVLAIARAKEVTMDALLGLRSWKWHATDWVAAAVAGFAAGAVLMVLDLVWSSIFNAHGPWRTSYMLAPILMGQESLRSAPYHFSVGIVSVALLTHYLLGISFGLATGFALSQLELDASLQRAALAGLVFGGLLYLVNFGLLVSFFPWLAELRGWDTFLAHLVMGVVTAVLYWRFNRTAGGR